MDLQRKLEILADAAPDLDPFGRSGAAALSDHRPSAHLLDGAGLKERFKPKAAQLGFGF